MVKEKLVLSLENEAKQLCFGSKEFHKTNGICMRCKHYMECKKVDDTKRTKVKY